MCVFLGDFGVNPLNHNPRVRGSSPSSVTFAIRRIAQRLPVKVTRADSFASDNRSRSAPPRQRPTAPASTARERCGCRFHAPRSPNWLWYRTQNPLWPYQIPIETRPLSKHSRLSVFGVKVSCGGVSGEGVGISKMALCLTGAVFIRASLRS